MCDSEVMRALSAVRSVPKPPFRDSARWIDTAEGWIRNGPGPEDTARRFVMAGGDASAIVGKWTLREVKGQFPLVGSCTPDELAPPHTLTLALTVVADNVAAEITVCSSDRRCVAATVDQPMNTVLTLLGTDDYIRFTDHLAAAVAADKAVWEVMGWEMRYNIRAAKAEWLRKAKDAAYDLAFATLGEAFESDEVALPEWTKLPAVKDAAARAVVEAQLP